MTDDAREKASQLIQEYGLDGASEMVVEELLAAHRDGDFYSVSVWREVRRELRDRRSARGECRPM